MRFFALCWLCVVSGCSLRPLAVPIDPEVLRTDGTRVEEEQFLTLDVGHGVRLPARIAVTTKGNGTLQAPGVSIHVVDLHDDGAMFEDGQLEIRLVDVDGDGYRDLFAYGVRVESATGETPERRIPVLTLCLFDPETRRFIESQPTTPWLHTSWSPARSDP